MAKMTTLNDFVQPSLFVPPMQRDLSMRALESVHARVSELDVSPVVVLDYEHVPASALPALAEQAGLLGAGWDFANFGPSVEAKQRQLLKQAVPLQAQRGTRYAVENALAAMDVTCRVTEWWEESPPAAPYTFTIDLLLSDGFEHQPMVTRERVDALIRAVTYWKSVRSGFAFRIGVQYANTLRVANAQQHQHIGRFSCAAQAVTPEPFANSLRTAGVMGRGLTVLRHSMETRK